MSYRDDICDFAATFDGAWRDPAWDIEGAVFKTAGGKIFLVCAGDDRTPAVTLKLPADEAAAALTLPFVKAAAWPSRWITASVTVEAERDIVLDWITRSYGTVMAGKARRPRDTTLEVQ